MNGTKAKLARKKAEEVMMARPELRKNPKKVYKMVKKAVMAGLICLLMALNCYADTLIFPSRGLTPKEFRDRMRKSGYNIEYSVDKVSKKTYAYCEYRGQEFLLHTVKPATEEELVDLMKMWGA